VGKCFFLSSASLRKCFLSRLLSNEGASIASRGRKGKRRGEERRERRRLGASESCLMAFFQNLLILTPAGFGRHDHGEEEGEKGKRREARTSSGASSRFPVSFFFVVVI